MYITPKDDIVDRRVLDTEQRVVIDYLRMLWGFNQHLSFVDLIKELGITMNMTDEEISNLLLGHIQKRFLVNDSD